MTHFISARDCGLTKRFGSQPNAEATLRLYGMNLSHAWPTPGRTV